MDLVAVLGLEFECLSESDLRSPTVKAARRQHVMFKV